MTRDPARLADESFDVLIVGGGIYGLTLAYDAALRGLKTALVERRDFGSGTSFNHHRTVHGGLRYLQAFDVGRMRDSIRERRALAKIAPSLVSPLGFLMPTRGAADAEHLGHARRVRCRSAGRVGSQPGPPCVAPTAGRARALARRRPVACAWGGFHGHDRRGVLVRLPHRRRRPAHPELRAGGGPAWSRARQLCDRDRTHPNARAASPAWWCATM